MVDNILITGGNGFIGQHTVKVAKAAGLRVTVLDPRNTPQEGTQHVLGSVTDKELVQRLVEEADYIVHLAAIADVAECERNPAECYLINVIGTSNILRAASRSGGRNIVLASSASVYGGTGPFDESAKRNPGSIYAKSKYAMEQQAAQFDTTNVCILRYFSVYGPGQIPKPHSYSWPVATFCMRALRGDPLLVHGNGLQTRDFVHVTDVAKATIAGCRAGVKGTMNVGSGVGTSILDLARHVQTLVPETRVFVGTSRPKHDPWGGSAVITRAREQLGWEPTLDLASGLKSYLEWLDAYA